MSDYTQKIKSSRIVAEASTFVGEDGRIFFDQADGILRLSNGVTPGGIIVGGSGSGNAVILDCGSASALPIDDSFTLDCGEAT